MEDFKWEQEGIREFGVFKSSETLHGASLLMFF